MVSRGLASDGLDVFVGELVASGFAAFAGLVGGGAGEQGVAAGFPAGSGVGKGADDQDGFVVGVVGGADGAVFGPVSWPRR